LGPTFWSLEEFGGALRKKREGGGRQRMVANLLQLTKEEKK